METVACGIIYKTSGPGLESNVKTSRQCSSVWPRLSCIVCYSLVTVWSHGFFLGALGVLNLKKIMSPSSTT